MGSRNRRTAACHETGGLAAIAFALAAILALGAVFTASLAQASESVTIFSNGVIHLDASRTARNLAVRDGKVIGVDVAPADYENARVVDLQGNVAYPGFIDSHCHLMEAGFFLEAGVNLEECSDAACMAEKLKKHAAKLDKKDALLLGLGFSLKDYDAWSLDDLAKIDKATDGHPALLMDSLGHNVVVNSAAMKLAGIKAGMQPPPGGKMVAENGKPTGMLRESAALKAGNTIYAMFDERQIKTGTLKLLQMWAAMGYTSIVDMMGAPSGRIMHPDVFRELEKEGSLPVRVNYNYTIYKLDDVEKAAQFRGKDTDMVRFAAVKLFVDGAYAGGMAWTTWTNELGNHGLHYVDGKDFGGKQYELASIVKRLDELKLNAHYHIQGDKGIEVLLSALDKAAGTGELSSTHTIVHAAFPTKEQLAHIKRFNGRVVTTVQPAFWEVEEDAEHYYGKRAAGAYPIKKLIDAGLSVGMSTDFSVSPLAYAPPTMLMKVAATGAGPGRKPVSVQEVVHGLTVGSAAVTPKDDVGILDVGYKADMVVYDRELFQTSPDSFDKHTPKVVSTWLAGRKVELPDK